MSVSLEERHACRSPRFFLRAGKKASSSEGTLLERSAPQAKRSFSGATHTAQHVFSDMIIDETLFAVIWSFDI